MKRRYERLRPSRVLLIVLAAGFIHCAGSAGGGSGASSADDASSIDDSGGMTLAGVASWGYQLQDIDPEEIGDSRFDLVVVDYSGDGSDEEAFSSDDVAVMKGEGATQKLVVSYMSIGEAEDYRFYFDGDASYIDGENEEWPGNFKVYYWDPEWQAVIDDYTDRLIDAGFDGAYLDIIDAYEFFGPGGDSGLERDSAADDMVDFVSHIAEYARARDPDFLIIPQNGSGLINATSKTSEYFGVLDAIGAEDSFYFGDADENNPLDPQEEILDNLDAFAAAGKPVLSIDYVTEPDLIDDYYERAEERGYVPYASVRDLDELTVSEGHEPE